MSRRGEPQLERNDTISEHEPILDHARESVDVTRAQLQALLAQEGISKGAEAALQKELSVLEPLAVPTEETVKAYRRAVSHLSDRASGARKFGQHISAELQESLRTASAGRLTQLMDALRTTTEDVPQTAQWRTWEAALRATVRHETFQRPDDLQDPAQQLLRGYVAIVPFNEIDSLQGSLRGQHMGKTTSEKGMAFLHIANLAAMRAETDPDAERALEDEQILYRLREMMAKGIQPSPLTPDLGARLGSGLSPFQKERIFGHLYARTSRGSSSRGAENFVRRLGLEDEYTWYVRDQHQQTQSGNRGSGPSLKLHSPLDDE